MHMCVCVYISLSLYIYIYVLTYTYTYTYIIFLLAQGMLAWMITELIINVYIDRGFTGKDPW